MIAVDDDDLPKNSETSRYLDSVEKNLYADIQSRKRIDSGLLFLACQFSSCSLSWLLFQLQITLSIIQLASVCLSCLPGLIDIGDSFQFSINSESWEFSLGNKPLVGIIKLVFGGTVAWNSTTKITKEITSTYQQINQTYQEIRSSEGVFFQLPDVGLGLLLGLGFLLGLAMFKKAKNKEDGNEI